MFRVSSRIAGGAGLAGRDDRGAVLCLITGLVPWRLPARRGRRADPVTCPNPACPWLGSVAFTPSVAR